MIYNQLSPLTSLTSWHLSLQSHQLKATSQGLKSLDERPIRVIHTPMAHDDHLRPAIDRWAIKRFEFLAEHEVRREQVLDP